MEEKAYETSGNLSMLRTWNKSCFIFAVLFVSSLSFPFRYPCFGFTFTNFLDDDYRHYMFLFCNGIILLFLFLESGSNHTSKASYSQETQALGPEVRQNECNVISFGSGLQEEEKVTPDQIEDMETERVIHVYIEHENETNVKQIDLDDHHVEEDDQETELMAFDCEHEIEAEVVEVEQDDDQQQQEEEEVHDQFQQKCEAFIKKVRQSMHHEGPMIDSDHYDDEL